jgi:hypothetical protein
MLRPDRIAQPAMPSRSRPPGSRARRPEAPPHNNPLFALPNVILTPHRAGLSKEAAIRKAISTARNVPAGINGKLDSPMVINREVLRDAVASRSRCQPETQALLEVAHQSFPLSASCLQRSSARMTDGDGS